MRAMTPRLLDLFCGAGGAAMGYSRAGFEVVGVDIRPQPDYPFEFYQADAMTYPLDGFDVIHASPPCQAYSRTRVLNVGSDHPDLLGAVQSRLAGVPYVIENVVGAPIANPLMLCGSMFGLRVRRHRLFESSAFLWGPPPCRHAEQEGVLVGVYGASDGAHEPGFKHPGLRRGPRQATTAEAREVMGMPWVRQRHGLIEAVPPTFTEFIGRQLLDVLAAAA
jgi:DNA (cytosine-5)-methyltransferase 1